MTAPHPVRLGAAEFGAGRLALIAGPCMAESLSICLETAQHLAELCQRLGIAYVFKASYDKANRSSADGFRG
ncbi:MAG: 3-deoxy-8-phosphooctulonate synthase, partial [Planctomycetota bacterium]